jgi:hypothetical protein
MPGRRARGRYRPLGLLAEHVGGADRACEVVPRPRDS